MTDEELLSTISQYAETSTSEAIAEAFSDYWTNGKNANPVSLKIIDVAKGMLS